MHQKEEKALHARVVEAEKQRDTAAQELEKQKDAAIREASKNSEAMKSLEAVKKESKGIPGSLCFFQYSNLSLLLTCCLVSCPALQVEGKTNGLRENLRKTYMKLLPERSRRGRQAPPSCGQL